MAKWVSKKNKRNCETCLKFRSPNSFAKGSRVFIAEAFDCANCEVTLSQPIQENENIIELYYALPERYNAFSGIKEVTASDIKFLFQIYNIHKDLWEDYYNRLMFYHNILLDIKSKQDSKEQKIEEAKQKKKVI